MRKKRGATFLLGSLFGGVEMTDVNPRIHRRGTRLGLGHSSEGEGTELGLSLEQRGLGFCHSPVSQEDAHRAWKRSIFVS